MKIERYSRFMKWYNLLPHHEKDKIDRLTILVLSCADRCLSDLEGETQIRKQMSGKPLDQFYQEEIEITSKALLRYQLNNQLELSELIGNIRHEIRIREISASELWIKPEIVNCEKPETFGIKGPMKLQELNNVIAIVAYAQYLLQLCYSMEIVVDIENVTKSNQCEENDNSLLNLLTRQIIHSTELLSINIEPFIERERLALIYRHYKEFWNEPENEWIDRFVISSRYKQPIEIDNEAVSGSNRLLILAILNSISHNKQAWLKDSDTPTNFEDFVKDNFGIPGYKKAISYIRNYSPSISRKEFDEVCGVCNKILEI